MDNDTESSCEDITGPEKFRKKIFHQTKVPTPSIYTPTTTDIYSTASTSQHQTDPCLKIPIKNPKKSLSAQVEEYYQKYSRGSNLDRYFSHPEANTKSESYGYHWRNRSEALPLFDSGNSRVGDLFSVSDLPRERRRWARPPLIGQPSGASSETLASKYPLNKTPSPEPESTKNQPESLQSYQQEDRGGVLKKSESFLLEPVDREAKIVSPTSSVASQMPRLEWDSTADVGYYNALEKSNEKGKNIFCTIEKMILSKELCSAELRLDPEGTTGSTVDPGSVNKIYNSPSRNEKKPNANSTRITGDRSESEEEEIEITPIVKPNLPGIIAGNIVVKEGDRIGMTNAFTMKKSSLENEQSSSSSSNVLIEKSIGDTPKILTKYATEKMLRSKVFKDFQGNWNAMRRKSVSMNILALAMPPTMASLARSQSELNLDLKVKGSSSQQQPPLPLNFQSSSSIATIVNKPTTCDKDIQTNLIEEASSLTKESIGIQVSSIETSESDPGPESKSEEEKEKSMNSTDKSNEKEIEEEKPPLPERVSSLGKNRLQSILKNHLDNKKESRAGESSQSERQDETTQSDAGRASNSFEYFPGHVYQNVAQARGESTSHVSSVDTGRSHSTMPNTSSSLDGKLWGENDSLVRDLETSLNLLKLLVDAKKDDKHVKKRLIHHLMKRLATAKYTDDKIEHNLEENVPWNPDNARNKVYRTKIIQALATKPKQSNTSEESSEDWKPRKNKTSNKSDVKTLREMIRLVVSSENSDLFEERHTDRTTDGLQDGRTARMAVRTEDRHQRHSGEIHDTRNSLDTEKSESSECFLPTTQKTIDKKKPSTADLKIGKAPSTTTTTTSNSINVVTSSKRINRDDLMDWRLPVTMSERQFELERSNCRAGVSSKLIDYVQMEKKNQLFWINNEINHLSYLRKLLEEPKRYSPTSQAIFEDKKTLSDENPVSYSRRRKRGEEISEQQQWSSHGNLAEKPDKSQTKKIQARKQNICTQTKVIDDDLVRVRHDARPINSSSVSSVYDDQTLEEEEESSRVSTPAAWSPRRSCTQHGNKKDSCVCPKPVSSSLEVLPIVKAKQSKQKEAPRPNTISQPLVNSKKDTKNRLNDRCKSEVIVTEYQAQYSPGKSSRHCKSCRCSSKNIQTLSDKSQQSRATGKETTGDESDECACNKIQNVRSCRACGTLYDSMKNRKCKCVQTYVQPIAYELSFEPEEKKKPAPRKKEKSSQVSLQSASSSDSEQPLLQDYLTKNKPEFVDKIEKRQRCMSELSHLRELKREKRNQYLAMSSPSSLIISEKNIKPPVISTRKISDEEMKTRLRLRYLRLNEVKNKRREKEKEEQTRRNHLMAKIYCKKLQQKVLKGQVDLSQSVSVISNL